MPVARWLGTWEYAGVWLHGGADSLFDTRETFYILGDSRMSSIHAAMAVFSQGVQTQSVAAAVVPRQLDALGDYAC